MKVKKIPPKNIEEQVRHIGVLFERTHDDVKQIAEQVDNLDRRFGNLEGRFDNMEGRFDNLEGRFGGMENKFEKMQQTLDGHTEMIGKLAVVQESHSEKIDKLTNNMEIVKSDVQIIKNSIKAKVDTDDFAALERRVILLERRA